MAYGFNDDKSKVEMYTKDEAYSKDEVYNKAEVIPKNQQYSNSWGSRITIPCTTSGSVKTYNYTFPNDGYLLVGFSDFNIGSLPLINFDLALKGASRGSIPIADILKFNYSVTKSISSTTITYETRMNYSNGIVQVKKGMKLSGEVRISSGTTNKFKADFYPFDLYN